MSDDKSAESIIEKPAQVDGVDAADEKVTITNFPEPVDVDFDEDIGEEERNYYKNKYKDLNDVKTEKLHCSACHRHLGCAARSETRMRSHPMLRTLVCHLCHAFYNSGEFEKGEDGSELYCRWCGQGGQVYCCSDCPHVFCAKCIKRNLGSATIKEIESVDDWKCFKCVDKPLWDLRALCWALMRYCDLKNRLAYTTSDPDLKEKYQKDCAVDDSICCKDKRRKSKRERDSTEAARKSAEIISKISPTIQVKKFASIAQISPDEKKAKKAMKRPASPAKQSITKKALIVAPFVPMQPPVKKMRMSQPMVFPNAMKLPEKPKTYSMTQPINIRPKMMPIRISNPMAQYNGYRTFIPNDNINLSLDSLTQGLDMASVAMANAQTTANKEDDVVCTPDLLLEPLCEVAEDNNDDDVQCITPGPIAAPKVNCPLPPLMPRPTNILPDLSPDNIVQMSENDVTVNAQTGGLKFRIDPQTLSCKKMYRLPDGRIFAINANPNMPGGYSATIVAVTEMGGPKGTSRNTASSTGPVRAMRNVNKGNVNKQLRKTPATRVTRGTDTPSSNDTYDLDTPVEWFRYNLIDGIDALQYSLLRLQRMKREATSAHLRSRTVDEMRTMHNNLERILNNSASRFHEIRENLNKGLKSYMLKKFGNTVSEEEDDDDVEILPNLDDSDDLICIDEENSMDSNKVESNNTNSNDLESSEPNNIVDKEPAALKTDSNSRRNSISDDKEESSSNVNNAHESDAEVQNDETSNTKVDDFENTTKYDEDGLDNLNENTNEGVTNEIDLDTSEEKDLIKNENDQIENEKDPIENDKDLIDNEKDLIDNEKDLIDNEKDLIDNEKDPIADEKDTTTNNAEPSTNNDNFTDKDEPQISEPITITNDSADVTKEEDSMTETSQFEEEELMLKENLQDTGNIDMQGSPGKLEDAEMSDDIIKSLLEDDPGDGLDMLNENESILGN